MTRGRHNSPAAPATLPNDDDILSEILLRLPPRPSSLPRASLVCKRWRCLVTDPHFRRRFCSRHPNPPLIGFFDEFIDFPFFRSIMDPPDLIAPKHFCSPIVDEKGGCDPDRWSNFGCRHGRMFLYNRKEKEIVVWDPPTGDHRRIVVPLEFHDYKERIIWNGTELCAAARDHSHVHGGFCSCPFKVAVVGVTRDHTQVFASIYSSQTGKWSNLVSAAVPFEVYYVCHPGVLVGNALHWMHLGHGCGIAKFDLDTNTLVCVECPSGADFKNGGRGILLAQNGVLCMAICSGYSIQMWERKVCSEGVANWELSKSDKLQKILGQRSTMFILGYADDINVMALWIDGSCYTLQLNSLQFTKLWKTNIISNKHPYASIYDSGLYAEMDKEELIEGVNIMLRVAESLLEAQRRTEGGAKQLTDEHLEEDGLLAAQRRTEGGAKQLTDEEHLEDSLLAAQHRTEGGAKQLTDEEHLEVDDMSE